MAVKHKPAHAPKAKIGTKVGTQVKAKAKANTKANIKAKAKVKFGLKTMVSSTAEGSSKPRACAQQEKEQCLAAEMKQRDSDWRIGSVVYQVFVDRFVPPADLDLETTRALFPEPCALRAWSERPQKGSQNKEVGYWEHEYEFWGGNLVGLTSKLQYLQEIGINIVYLQPICRAFSNHKYDATDFLELDPQYGTLNDFARLVEGIHARGMRLVLDGVFNHMGHNNPVFKEALGNPASVKRGWFYFDNKHERGFKTWSGTDNLIELRLESPSLQDYLWKGQGSVVATWLRRGADGWRLDVASELGFDLLASLTEHAHRHKEGSLVVGEVWAYPPRWTSAMDGVLSLHLGVLILGFAEHKCCGTVLTQSVARLVEDSSIQEVLRSWIVLSNHDMPRLASRLPDLQMRKLAQVLQFTLPGCPLVYYGDEIGLEGGEDPDNRATFQWQQAGEENAMLVHTRVLTMMRQRLRALRIGDFRALPTREATAFVRSTEKVMDTVVIMANSRNEAVQEMVVVPDPRILGHTLFRDELGSSEVRAIGSTLTVEVPPQAVLVFAMVDESGSPSGDQYKRMPGHWASMVGAA